MEAADLVIETVVSYPFEENTFVIRCQGSKDCLIVDPGLEPDKIFTLIDDNEYMPLAILNTHGHSDHIAGNGAMKKRWPDCPLIIGHQDAEKLTDPVKNLSAGYGLPIVSPAADKIVRESDRLDFAGIELEVLEIPGHSLGHVVFIHKTSSAVMVIGGDVLFAGSVGRTDFPDGNQQDLITNIHQKLFTLPDDTIVLTGHGPATTIGEEKRSNPFVGAPAGFAF